MLRKVKIFSRLNLSFSTIANALDLLKASGTAIATAQFSCKGGIFNFPFLISSLLRMLSWPIRTGETNAFCSSISLSKNRIGKEAPAVSRTSLDANRACPKRPEF